MLGESGLIPRLARFQKPNGEPYVLYGDPAYGVGTQMLAPFRGVQLTNDQRQFNSRMSKVRTSVGWVWQNNPKLCIFGFQKEPKGPASASCKILHSCCGVNQLSHLSVWVPDRCLLQPGASITGKLPQKCLNHHSTVIVLCMYGGLPKQYKSNNTNVNLYFI